MFCYILYKQHIDSNFNKCETMAYISLAFAFFYTIFIIKRIFANSWLKSEACSTSKPLDETHIMKFKRHDHDETTIPHPYPRPSLKCFDD